MTNFQQIFNDSLVISGIKEIDDNLAAMVNGGNCPCSDGISEEANSAISLLNELKTEEAFRFGGSIQLIDNFSSKSLNEVKELAAEGCVELNQIQTGGLESAIDIVEFNETVPEENPFEIAA